jgi:hypothetical protein
MVEVRATYPFNGSFYRDEAATHAVGRPADFSGCGMGERDLGWVCKSEFEALRIKRALGKIGLSAVVGRQQPQETADG